MTDAYLPSHLPGDNHNRQTADTGENMTEFATVLARETVSELVRAGVRDFVISPGSRSAPLTYALAALEQVGLVRTHVRLDERSAAFFALGLAKSGIYLQDSVKSRTETTGFEDGSRATLAATADSATDLSAESCNNEVFTESYTPVALVVTSGTAVAELGAGIMEAFHAGIPLMVLTADRPRAMRGTGANQTTWQEGIYGRYCPVALDIDATEDGVEESVEKIRCAVSRAWDSAAGRMGQCCPVHINLCFAPPLVSSENWEIPQDLLQAKSGEDAAIFPRVAGNLTSGHQSAGSSLGKEKTPGGSGRVGKAEGRLKGALAALDEADRVQEKFSDPRSLAKTVVVLADQCPQAVQTAAAAWGLPVLAEPTVLVGIGRAVQIAHSPQVLPALASEIRQVIVAGHATLSRSVAALLSRRDIPIYSLPSLGAKTNLTGKYVETTVERVGEVFPKAADTSWLQRWQRAAHAVEDAYRRCVDSRAVTVWQNSKYAALDSRPGSPGKTAEEVALSKSTKVVFATSGDTARASLASEVAHRLRLSHSDNNAELEESLRELEMGIDPFAFARIYEDVYAPESSQGCTPPLTMLGASNTIRAFDLAARGGRGIRYCANRGLSGIDGNISTALGLAAGTGRAVRLIAGDLTCLHDLTGLLTGQLEKQPVVQVMVLNDRGGNIFATLEHGEQRYREVFPRYFLTPQRFDFSALATGLGWEYRCAQDAEELKKILRETPRREIVEINAYLPDLRSRRALLESVISSELSM